MIFATLLSVVLAAPVDPAALLLPADAAELAVNPALRTRLGASPHAYLRGTGARFAGAVCGTFAREAAAFPEVTLHGDAHLEQYAVTASGRGLTDFDDATTGSALVDLARFATSLELAARERSFPSDAGAGAQDAFVRGYRQALRAPNWVAPEPAIARALRQGFTTGHRASLARAESLMRPLAPGTEPPPAKLQRASEMLAEAARRPVSFFRIKKLGLLGIGIGSAADERYLMRVDGPSRDDADDVMLELKEVRRVPDLPCLRAEPGGTRILVAQARLAYEAFSYVGTLALESPAGPRYYWFHAWPDDYAELRISSLRTPAELAEVAFDVGVQLGRGHARAERSGDARRRRTQLEAALAAADLGPLARALADATEEAWRRFKEQTP